MEAESKNLIECMPEEPKCPEDSVLDSYRDDPNLKEFFRLPKHIQFAILGLAIDSVKKEHADRHAALKKLIRNRKKR